MASKGGSPADGAGPNYPKQYWWLVLIVVPMVAALIQYQPWKGASGSSAAPPGIGNQFLGPAIIGNVSVVLNEAAKAGATVDPALREKLQQAVDSSKSGDHDAAIAKIEALRTASRPVGELPSLLNNLGFEYLSAGRPDQAKATFEEILRKDPTNKTAWAGLSRLPDQAIAPLKIVNFSSEYGAGNLGYRRAIDIVDQNPGTSWLSARDATLPHSFVIELPVDAAISELSFNNPTFGDTKYAAKEVEASFSEQSPTSGFDHAVKTTLLAGEIGQGLSLKPARNGRWVKLRILTNYGDPAITGLGDVSVIGRPNPR